MALTSGLKIKDTSTKHTFIHVCLNNLTTRTSPLLATSEDKPVEQGGKEVQFEELERSSDTYPSEPLHTSEDTCLHLKSTLRPHLHRHF